MYVLVKKLQHLKIILKDWNKEVFGPVEYCLQNSRQILEMAQLASLNDPSNLTFINEESAAKEEYLSMLRREESFLCKNQGELGLWRWIETPNSLMLQSKLALQKTLFVKYSLMMGALASKWILERPSIVFDGIFYPSTQRPKVEGGLGLKLLSDWNSTAMSDFGKSSLMILHYGLSGLEKIILEEATSGQLLHQLQVR
ncbi:hypothetical protein QJS10_CPA07g00932 [Acorus calamus]|uniref:Uncharacterized protein n=1 Tax=Acorus calamus TaxID=4465 RepID=A0AAV9EHG3_ACOCL|nr:hypothetical protein QJS10_CPA07g00932 [Acorus calamus]